jgi:hypothetical protein
VKTLSKCWVAQLVLVRRMRPSMVALGYALFATVISAAPPRPDAKAIVGSWILASKYRPTRIIVFHADGSWGVRKFDERPEDIRGRRWRVEDGTVVLKYPDAHGFQTARYKIVSFTPRKFVTEIHGYESTYTRVEQPR